MDRAQRREWRRHVFGCADLTHGERLVLLALEGFADYPAGTNARPGRAVLAEMCGLGTRVADSALAKGQRLKLIDQTGRANPKAGLAAVYRLLPAPVSTRTSVRPETDFNSHETDFNSHEDDISTRTSVRPTNKEHQAIDTKDKHARARDAANPISLEAATTAAQLVKQQIGPQYPKAVRAKLATHAADLITSGTPPDIVADALRLWTTKEGVGPGILPWLVSDVIKSRNGQTARPARSTVDQKVAGWQTIPVHNLDDEPDWTALASRKEPD